MSKKMDSAQLKIAEKLVILNDRSQGMLTRIYNVKKACASMESKPRFLKEDSMKSAINHILKKFPSIDVKRTVGISFLWLVVRKLNRVTNFIKN
jgi:NCK-associated protein 1